MTRSNHAHESLFYNSKYLYMQATKLFCGTTVIQTCRLIYDERAALTKCFVRLATAIGSILSSLFVTLLML